MLCPKCNDVMVTYERNSVHVDQCRGCRGLYLDFGELEALVAASSRYYERKRREAEDNNSEEKPETEAEKKKREEEEIFDVILNFI